MNEFTIWAITDKMFSSMIRTWIAYFCKKPLIVNVVLFSTIFSAVLLWKQIGKEELPEFSMNFLRCVILYPGASAQDVELFVTKPIEENLKGVSGLYEVNATSSYGSASFRITVDPHIRDFAFREKVQDLKDAIERTELPRETEDPVYSQFNSDEKAIIDIGFYLEGEKTLRTQTRQKLQAYALAYKNKLLSLTEVSGVESNGYLRPEIQILVDPQKIEESQVSMATIGQAIIDQHVRVPAGNMTDARESEISLHGELKSLESISQTIVQSGFEGQKVTVKDLAITQDGFERSNSIRKIQGHEAIVFNIQKSSSVDILTAQEKISSFTKKFLSDHEESGLRIITMDDESYDVRNRLSIIGGNGIIGFVLIVLVLFLFLNFSTGFWVAMGIPFSLAVTLIGAMLFGFTINNMTLASIIIVLGIVVDDAIIIAENINRHLWTTRDRMQTAINSTIEMMKPVLASILTTCAAFIPLYFFTGRFGLFVKYIPTVVFLMLLASLVESAFVLPSHMIHPLPWKNKQNIPQSEFAVRRRRWIAYFEKKYQNFLLQILPLKHVVILLFILLLGISGYIGASKMKYVMFPREETKELFIKAYGPDGIKRYEMSKLVEPLENIFLQEEIVEAVRTRIGQSRRGGEVKENEASIRVELIPPSQRNKPLKHWTTRWEDQSSRLPGLTKVRFMKHWWGSDSGSPIEIEVQENNDKKREEVVANLETVLQQKDFISNVEVERPITKREYKLHVDKAKASKLQIDFQELASSIRSYVEGRILYILIDGEEEVDVRLSSQNHDKQDIEKIMNLYTSNRDQYLIPIGSIVNVEETEKPANIARVNFKRSTKIFADLKDDSTITPLEVAQKLESDTFPMLTKGSPSTNLAFRGEIENSRESQGDFVMSIFLVLLLIYVLLVFLFNSLSTPLLIASIIPFGAVGVVLSFTAHGMYQYGFFAVIGALGMTGVVINDAIVMLNKLENDYDIKKPIQENLSQLVEICSTRLRPIILTTLTTIAGIFPTTYGIAGYDSMLSEMMLAMGWGLLFGTLITLILVPSLYVVYIGTAQKIKKWMPL